VDRREKRLVKIVVHDADKKEVRSRVLFRLLRKYKPKTVQFFVYLDRQQIAGLKRYYGGKISIIYGELLHRDRWDRVPEEYREKKHS